MAKLIYSAIASLDLYTADSTGNFDWAAPDDEVHTFVNDMERPIGTYLLGRRMYEVMAWWETIETSGASAVTRDFAKIWRGADKIVYSRTLQEASTAKTRIEREFHAESIRRLKQSSARDISIGGSALAGEALRAGLVDDCHLYLTPILVGGGTSVFPSDIFLALELVDERRFAGGVVYLRYRVGVSA